MSRKRGLLLIVALLLSLSAFFAIAVLLAGRFGRTEGRILGSAVLLAGFGLVAAPAVVLSEQDRAARLAVAGVASAAVSSLLALAGIWSGSNSEALGRAIGSAVVVALALSQACALTARQATNDPTLVRRLFTASLSTAALTTIGAVALVWTSPEGNLGPRIVGALLVLNLLLVALQPIFARARPEPLVHRFDVVLTSGERVPVSVTGGDIASAAARAIRSIEHNRGDNIETSFECLVRSQDDPVMQRTSADGRHA